MSSYTGRSKSHLAADKRKASSSPKRLVQQPKLEQGPLFATSYSVEFLLDSLDEQNNRLNEMLPENLSNPPYHYARFVVTNSIEQLLASLEHILQLDLTNQERQHVLDVFSNVEHKLQYAYSSGLLLPSQSFEPPIQRLRRVLLLPPAWVAPIEEQVDRLYDLERTISQSRNRDALKQRYAFVAYQQIAQLFHLISQVAFTPLDSSERLWLLQQLRILDELPLIQTATEFLPPDEAQRLYQQYEFLNQYPGLQTLNSKRKEIYSSSPSKKQRRREEEEEEKQVD